MKNKSIVGLFMFLILAFLVGGVLAEKLGIDIENNYAETGSIDFKITVYDDNNNEIEGVADFKIINYYSEVVHEGKANSGEEITFKLPENVDPRPWGISASYKGAEIMEKFNIEKLRKIDIKLEGDKLIIKNIGNTDYEGDILIYIGEHDQNANIFLARGQTKKIRLTAPEDEYIVRVKDDVGGEELVFSGVKLTGNVVGLERVLKEGFWRRYPLVILFLGAVGLVVVIVFGLRLRKRFF